MRKTTFRIVGHYPYLNSKAASNYADRLFLYMIILCRTFDQTCAAILIGSSVVNFALWAATGLSRHHRL